MGSRRLFLGILVLLLLLFNQLGLAANNGRIGILATINLSGIEKSGLENKLAANIASILRNEGAYTVIEEKEIGKRLKKIKMEDITEYINLLSVKEISSLCRLIEVDQVIVISIEGYNEFVRKKQKSYQIKALIDWYRPEFQLVQSFRGDSISQKGMNDVIEKCARQMSGKLIGLPVETDDDGIRGENAPVVVNTNSNRYHLPNCRHLPRIEDQRVYNTRREADQAGHTPCLVCFPSFYSYIDPDKALEDKLGAESAGTLEYYYRVAHDPEQLARVKAVAGKIIPHTRRKNVDYAFYLLDTDMVNAFSLPGGYIYVTTGLLKVVESDDELAFILGHEMAHNVRKHAIAQYRQAMGLTFLSAILILSNDSDNKEEQVLLATFLNNLIMNGYSQKQEREADRLGAVYAVRSGYDQNAYKTVLGKFMDMRERSSYLLEKLFSTHPTPEARLDNINKYWERLNQIQMALAMN
ncbi:MAG TPA: M48 family metalloprotease [Firmicutes bacterium]|nr:M48 family metalloprotease [Bacillota bacterium]